MSWAHSYDTHSAGEANHRLTSARDTFLDAQRALEHARDDLLRAHAESARLPGASRVV